MGIFEKIKSLSPQDTPSKVIAGFIAFAVVGALVSSVIIFIPEVRNQVNKVVPFIPKATETKKAGVSKYYSENYVGFGVSKTKGINYVAKPEQDNPYDYPDVSSEIYVAPNTTLYFYWDAPTFSPEAQNNKGKYPWTKKGHEEPKTWWIGCRASASRGFTKDLDAWRQGVMKEAGVAKGGKFKWAGTLDKNGNYTRTPADVTQYIDSVESARNPNGGYAFSFRKLGRMEIDLQCTKFDNNVVVRDGKKYGNTLFIGDTVTVNVTPDGKPIPEKEPLSTNEIDQYKKDGDALYAAPDNLGVAKGCGAVKFSWTSPTENLIPEKTQYEVVVSNDPYFGTFAIGSWSAHGQGTGNDFTVPSSGVPYAGARTDGTSISMAPGVFAGDAMPIPGTDYADAVDVASTFGVGIQSGARYLRGTFYWKVLTKTEYGISKWVDGESFRIDNCPKPGEDPNPKVKSFNPSRDPATPAPTADTIGAGKLEARKIDGCGTDNIGVLIYWVGKYKTPKGFKHGYELRISTDPKFSSFGTPQTLSKGLTSFAWSSNVNDTQRSLKGDVDPFTDGVQNTPVSGKTYYMQVVYSFSIAGGKSFTFSPVDGAPFTVCSATQPPNPNALAEPVDNNEDAKDIVIEEGKVTEEELNIIIKYIDQIRALITLFGWK